MALIPPLVIEFGLDAMQLLVCGIILVLLICNRRHSRSRGASPTACNGASSFRSEVMLQAIKQQVERSFETISETLGHERRFFDQFVEQYPWGAQIPRRSAVAAGSVYPTVKSEAANFATDHETDPHEIDQLRREGMGPIQIAEHLKIPLEEVQLRLSLSNPPAKPNANRRMPGN